jgi:hypothetical protein
MTALSLKSNPLSSHSSRIYEDLKSPVFIPLSMAIDGYLRQSARSVQAVGSVSDADFAHHPSSLTAMRRFDKPHGAFLSAAKDPAA